MLGVVETEQSEGMTREESALDRLARRMLEAALEAEAAAYVERHRSSRDAKGLALVVLNGHAQERKIAVGAGGSRSRPRS